MCVLYLLLYGTCLPALGKPKFVLMDMPAENTVTQSIPTRGDTEDEIVRATSPRLVYNPMWDTDEMDYIDGANEAITREHDRVVRRDSRRMR